MITVQEPFLYLIRWSWGFSPLGQIKGPKGEKNPQVLTEQKKGEETFLIMSLDLNAREAKKTIHGGEQDACGDDYCHQKHTFSSFVISGERFWGFRKKMVFHL